MKPTFILVALTILFSTGKAAAQKTIHYDLYVNDTVVNYSGKKADGIAINGQIPAPTLEFTEGDTAEIVVHNLMNTETSIHWHGIILPNNQDGVPYLTTAPIKAHTTARYSFPIVQNGTYWYHSHTKLQEQSGLYGALIIHKKKKETLPEFTVLLSDWTNENPQEVLRSLKSANDWYAIKKHATQNWGEATLKGHFGTKAKQEWLRMLAMDVSDVYYNRFLVNGKTEERAPSFKAGDKVRLRIINGSASTYFWLQFAGSKLQVIASDGIDVVPVEVDRMIIAVAETYDVIVTIPENMSYELKATPEDRTSFTSLWIGDGMKMPAPDLPALKYFDGMKMMNKMMNFDGSMDDMDMKMSAQSMDMNVVMYPEITGPEKGEDKKKVETEMSNMQHDHHIMPDETAKEIRTLDYTMLRATERTTLSDAPFTELQ
ncbi:MAG TPA: multicopper oxidase domain-containing protein, partial [Chitinophagales bacterium]|nr:multicopper oxidase domain-containing protein [Chitinophagales bacterium]